MIHSDEIWHLIQKNLPKGQWISLQDIYNIIERYGKLDNEDFLPQSPDSDIPKWKRNVRNVLQYRRKTEEIKWDGDAKYLLH